MAHEIGSLEVTVVDAVQLPVVNHIGKQNPFVVVTVGAQRLQTKPSKTGHRNPVWGERLNFAVDNGTIELGLDAYHDSKYGRPVFIGTAVVPLDQALASGTSSKRVRLGTSGEVRLQIAFIRTPDANGAALHSTAAAAGQALQNASSSLAAALPGQQSLLQVQSPWNSRKSLQNAEVDGPTWLSGQPQPQRQASATPPPRAEQIQPATSMAADNGLANGRPTEESVRAEGVPLEGSRWGSLGSRAATSPQKSFRAKVGHKLGNFWHGKEGGRAGSATLDAPGGIADRPSGANSESSAEGVGADGTRVPARQHGDAADQTSERQQSGRLAQHDAAQPRVEPSSTAWQGMQMEPFGSVYFDRPDGSQAWLRGWERRLEPGRRATDTNAPVDDAEDGTAWPRRQTDSAYVGPGTGDDGFFRRAMRVQEWGESRGQIPPMAGTDFPGPSRPAWSATALDGKAQHERLISAMEERMRSTSTRPLQGMSTHSEWPREKHTPAEKLSRQAGAIDSSHSTGEIGRRKQQGDPPASEAAEALEVEGSKRSDSAPPGGSRASRPSETSYPTPRFDDADDIANRFSSLGGPGSPPPVFAPTLAAEARDSEQSSNSKASLDPQRRVLGFGSAHGSNEAGRGAAAPRGAAQAREAPPPSFVGMVSPFAEDTSPLEAETLPPTAAGAIGHARSISAGARVPIRQVREELEAAAEGSVRFPPDHHSVDEASQQSLSALLSDSRHDWLIEEADLEIALDEAGNAIKLGSGAFGTVYKGMYDRSTEVAIKTLKCETQQDMNSALHEVAILKKQLHPNIVQFLGASIWEKSIQLVTELLAGNLYTALRKGNCKWHRGGKGIAKNIASALAFLHKKKVVHLDVKSANILLTLNKTAKLADLGLSAMMNTNSFVDTIKGLGTLQWTSPEVLLGNAPVTCASDVYSFGVVLWEICTGDVPQRGNLRLLHPDEAPPEISDLILKCIQADPKERPTMQQAFTVLNDERV